MARSRLTHRVGSPPSIATKIRQVLCLLDLRQSVARRADALLKWQVCNLCKSEEQRMNLIRRGAIKLFFLCLVTFAIAFGMRRMFFWDVRPVSWNQEPPQNGALEAAFLLLSIENIAAVVAVIALVFISAVWIHQRWRSRPQHIANSK